MAILAGVLTIALIMLTGQGESGAVIEWSSLRRGPISVAFPPPWTGLRAGSSARGVKLSQPLTLFGPREIVAVGQLENSNAVPGGPPVRFAALADGAMTQRRVRVGGLPAMMYRAAGGFGAKATLYVVATNRGDVGLLCSEALGATDHCAVEALKLSLHGRYAILPGADPVLAHALDAILGLVAAAGNDQAEPAPHESWRSLAAIAEHQRSVAEHAAGQLRRLSPEPRDRGAVTAVSDALAAEAAALDLTTALADARSSQYLQARVAVESKSEAAAAAVRRLHQIGFSKVPLLGVFSPPLPPRPLATEATTAPSGVQPGGEPDPGGAGGPSGESGGQSGGSDGASLKQTERSTGLESHPSK